MSLATMLGEVLSGPEGLNQLGQRLTGQTQCPFGQVTVCVPRLVPAELGFLRAVSWLYVLYKEAGKVSIPFLVDKFDVYGLDDERRVRDHLTLVEYLRTYFQHNLNLLGSGDQRKKLRCEDWFAARSGTRDPVREGDWERCLQALLEEALLLQSALKMTMESIENDESRPEICDQWVFRINRYHAPHEFDPLISMIAGNFGLSWINVVKVRKKHYDDWTNALELLEPGYCFHEQATILVEKTLLDQPTTECIPINGEDIINHFGLEPGPTVGRLRERALELYRLERCDRATLLRRLEGWEA